MSAQTNYWISSNTHIVWSRPQQEVQSLMSPNAIYITAALPDVSSSCLLLLLFLLSPPPVLVRYVRADGKIHTVNLQNANLSDGRTHSIILRVGGLQRSNMNMELYVNCRLADSSQGLPPLVPLPREAEMVEIRHGQKAYGRLQVRERGRVPGQASAGVVALSQCATISVSGRRGVPPAGSRGQRGQGRGSDRLSVSGRFDFQLRSVEKPLLGCIVPVAGGVRGHMMIFQLTAHNPPSPTSL